MLKPDLLKWAEEHADLLEWLRKADNDMPYGKVIIVYHEGKVTSFKVCPAIQDEKVITKK